MVLHRASPALGKRPETSTRADKNDENKVKITMRFRGREMAHKQFGFQVLERVKEETKEVAKVEQSPKLEGRQILMLLGPITT